MSILSILSHIESIVPIVKLMYVKSRLIAWLWGGVMIFGNTFLLSCTRVRFHSERKKPECLSPLVGEVALPMIQMFHCNAAGYGRAHILLLSYNFIAYS